MHRQSFGVFLSFYRQYDYFPGATSLQYGFIGGMSTGLAFLMAPVANYLASTTKMFQVPMSLGVALYVGGQLGAAFTNRVWQLFLTQGVMCGWVEWCFFL